MVDNGGAKVNKYRGVVEALTGMLVGGVRRHVSSTFPDYQSAAKWRDVIVDSNRTARRDVGRAAVERYTDGKWIEVAS
jgi:hypothetical protein